MKTTREVKTSTKTTAFIRVTQLHNQCHINPNYRPGTISKLPTFIHIFSRVFTIPLSPMT